MVSFIGSHTSGIQIDDQGIILKQNNNNAVTLSTSNNVINIGGYSIDNLGEFLNNLNLGNHKITNVALPTISTDVATKAYVDQALLEEIDPIIQTDGGKTKVEVIHFGDGETVFTNNEIVTMKVSQTSVQPKVTLDMGGLNKIVNVVDPTDLQDVTTKKYVDDRTVNTLSAQTADYSAQGFKITNLANAISDTDALNKQTGDSRYYLNNTPLNDMVVPVGDLDVNNNKLINLAPAQNLTDAVSLQGLLRYQWSYLGLTAALTQNITNQYLLPFNDLKQPLTNELSRFVQYDNTSNVITLAQGHYYEVTIQVEVSYTNANNQPSTLTLRNNSDQSVLKSFLTNRPLALNTLQLTQMKTLIDTTSASLNLAVYLDSVAQFVHSIGPNTHLLIKTLF